MRFFDGDSPVRRYLADASYWIYIVHLPVLFVLQVAVLELPLHWSIKFPFILAVAMAVLLGSYHALVRYTMIGEVLNGRRYRGTAARLRRQKRLGRSPAGRSRRCRTCGSATARSRRSMA